MKKLLLFITILSFFALNANAQFKINDKLFSTGFATDTAVTISIKLISLDILVNTKEQRPIFYLSFNNRTNQSIVDRNVDYSDIQKACDKNNIPLDQQEAIIGQTFSAVYAGTKAQKLGAIRLLLSSYGIILKPDDEQ